MTYWSSLVGRYEYVEHKLHNAALGAGTALEEDGPTRVAPEFVGANDFDSFCTGISSIKYSAQNGEQRTRKMPGPIDADALLLFLSPLGVLVVYTDER
jgi:hypothetical protein